MKFRFIFLFLIITFLFSCEKSENENNALSSSATIGGTPFNPEENSIQVSGSNIVMEFRNGDQKVTIVTNDLVAGVYDVVPDPVKSGGLLANLTYTSGSDTFTGTSGTVTVEISGSSYSGSYNASLAGEGNTTLEISSGSFSGIEGNESNLLLTETQINQAMEEVYLRFEDFVRYSFLFDAVYSTQVQAPDNSWSEVYAHTLDATNGKVLKLWEDGFGLIDKTTLVIASGKAVYVDDDMARATTSPAYAIRGYVNMVLLSWYGGIPVVDEPEAEQRPREAPQDVIEWIKYHADLCSVYLPDDNPDASTLSKAFAFSLSARANLYTEYFDHTYEATEMIMASGGYSLGTEPTGFEAGNPEIIYGFSKGTNPEFNAFFNKGQVVPVFRLTETMLIRALAGYALGVQDQALESLNMVRERRGAAPLSFLDQSILYNEMAAELHHEGAIFSMMKLLDMVGEVMPLDENRYLLPIPAAAMEENMNLAQNPGY